MGGFCFPAKKQNAIDHRLGAFADWGSHRYSKVTQTRFSVRLSGLGWHHRPIFNHSESKTNGHILTTRSPNATYRRSPYRWGKKHIRAWNATRYTLAAMFNCFPNYVRKVRWRARTREGFFELQILTKDTIEKICSVFDDGAVGDKRASIDFARPPKLDVRMLDTRTGAQHQLG